VENGGDSLLRDRRCGLQREGPGRHPWKRLQVRGNEAAAFGVTLSGSTVMQSLSHSGNG